MNQLYVCVCVCLCMCAFACACTRVRVRVYVRVRSDRRRQTLNSQVFGIATPVLVLPVKCGPGLSRAPVSRIPPLQDVAVVTNQNPYENSRSEKVVVCGWPVPQWNLFTLDAAAGTIKPIKTWNFPQMLLDVYFCVFLYKLTKLHFVFPEITFCQ